jgi:2-deoxy-D-gluconate 3-dehydrogenase
MVAGRDQAKNAEAVAQLRELGARADAVEADLVQESGCEATVARASEMFGRLDILVNNAGTNIRKQPQDYTLEDWRTVIDTNLTAAFLCSRAAYRHMRDAGGGKIIMIGSLTSLFGLPFAPAYSASKGGIVQLAKALASAWAADNIQVNAILPGWIDTELTRRGRAQIQGLHERVEARTPVGRWGVPDDLAGAAVFLAARASDFVTGTALPVDGGYAAQG